MRFVLDTSVILAIALAERGAEDAQRMARGGVFGTANFVEAVTRGEELGHAASKTLGLVSILKLELADVDRACVDQALALWRFRKQGLSLGDRLCLGLARARGFPVLTGDRRWKTLDVGANVVLFR